MNAALFDESGVAKVLITAPKEAVEKTAEHYGYVWREISEVYREVSEVPNLSELILELPNG